ncbi:hydroxymethylbilane synthase [Haladaptatus sp. DJG-WS-42]|uniref:hydroxymethylbilane synthase n=1 Tax=Haladaptatus sp. DJG-WS-42 TaxID=3120516 RepID=UPI0030CB499B
MTTEKTTIRLATRGSDLALRQASIVKTALEDRRHEVELVEVETTGDQLEDALIHQLGKTGAFVRSLDEKVLDGDVDGAVHSMKDMPTEMPENLVVAGVPQRTHPGDVLVTEDGSELKELSQGAVVGTSSLRRKAQLLADRPDLQVEPIRGNVDTRVQKLFATKLQAEHERRMEAEHARKGNLDNPDYETEYRRNFEQWFNDLSEFEKGVLEYDPEPRYDALVMAEAGLIRSGLDEKVQLKRLPMTSFVPAPGQGAIAVTARDGEMGDFLHKKLDHPRTRVETTVERTILAELNGGCIAPIGVSAVIQGAHVHTTVRVLSQDGEDTISVTRDLKIERHPVEARDLAHELADRGARELVEEAKQSLDSEE